MSILKRISALRRKVMRRLTKNVGNSSAIPTTLPSRPIEIKRILICRPNKRLGNLLLFTPLLQEIEATFPGCQIDLFVKGNLAPAVFKNYESIQKIIPLPVKPFWHLPRFINCWLTLKKNHYDLAINVNFQSSSGRLSTQFSNATYKFFGQAGGDLLSEYADHGHAAKSPVYAFRDFITHLGYQKKENKIPNLDIRLSNDEIDEGKKILKKIVNNENRTICLFTYATGEKCYSKTWWENFYEQLKTEFPDYNIIEILPVQNISMLSFRIPNYSNKDIRTIGSLIANTAIFISGDGGIMHLAASVNTPTVGLFSVTNKITFEPYGNKSIGIDTKVTDKVDSIKIIKNILGID